MTFPTPKVLTLIALVVTISACRTAMPQIRFGPPGTDPARLRADFPLTDAERQALTPESLKSLTQDQVDQIYARLSPAAIPDGPFRGDLFFTRDSNQTPRLGDLISPVPDVLGPAAALPIEQLARMFWRGKVLFRSQSIVRNRIEDLAILKPIITNPETIPKLTFDGQTTWLLFPARLSCGTSRFDTTRHTIVIDYRETEKIEGYREIPDKIAGPQGLNIFDEIRIIRRGFYLGRSYFGPRFALNFTLVDPLVASSTAPAPDLQGDCNAS
jgi:hypothetical protein